MTFRTEGRANAPSPARDGGKAFVGGDQERVQRTLNRLCIVVAVTILPAIFHNLISRNYGAVGLLGFQELTLGTVFWLNRAGLTRLSSIFLCYTTMTCATAFVSISSDGLRDSSVLMYPMAIVMGSLMLNLRPFIGFCLVTATCVVGAWAAEQYGLLMVEPRNATGYHYLTDVLIILTITATVSGLVGQHLKASFLESQQSEQRFKTLAEASFEGIALTERECFIDANQAFCEMLGYELPELMGKKVTDLVLPADREQILSNIRSGRDSQLEHVMLRKDGAERIVAAHGRTVPYLGRQVRITAFRDVTNRKLAEKALLESEENYRRLVELAPDAIAVHDFRKIAFVNSAAVSLFGGRSPEELIGRDPMDFVHPDSVVQTLERAAGLQDTGGSMPLTEIRMLRIDGSSIDAEIVSSVLSQSGKFAVQTVIRDVSQRKEAERQKRDLEEQLHQSRKLESIGRMAGGVAHDFNNLLTVINGYADLLLATIPERDPHHDSVAEISKAGERATRLTRQLLTLSRRQVIEPRPVDLNRLIQDDLDLLKRLMGEHIETILELDPAVPPVLADFGQLQQVLLNLAANARDAMPDGGRLTIETSDVEISEADRLPLGGIQAGLYVRLRVADTGTGIDKETQRHIFDPFFTTKRAEGGSGLGLAIVYGIVRQAGGAVSVESRPGSGATFQIFLPVAEVEAPSSEPVAAPMEADVRGDATVLVVEDQESVRKFTCAALASYGFQILEAAGGEEAIELARTYAGPIHLLLTDVMMPRMNGRELAERIVPLRPEAKVLFMSGYTQDVIASRGLLEQGLYFIAKPFAPLALVQKVAETLSSSDEALHF